LAQEVVVGFVGYPDRVAEFADLHFA
jgi:hypothetical protein